MRLNTVVTGTYNFPGTYKITYRVNGGEYRTLADNLSTAQNYTLAASPTALMFRTPEGRAISLVNTLVPLTSN